MELILRFFDKKTWSYYATINVLIPLILLIIFERTVSIQDMIFISILGMMEGNIYSKIIATGFLNFLVFKPNFLWIRRSIIYVVAIIMMNRIKKNNVIHRTIMNSTNLQFLMNIIIALWMCYIMYIILLRLYKHGRKINKNRK